MPRGRNGRDIVPTESKLTKQDLDTPLAIRHDAKHRFFVGVHPETKVIPFEKPQRMKDVCKTVFRGETPTVYQGEVPAAL